MLHRKREINKQANDGKRAYDQRPENALLFAERLAENTGQRGDQNDKPNNRGASQNLLVELHGVQTEFVEEV